MDKPTVRQARLRAEAADHYPTLPVHVWTSADSLAQLVASFPAPLAVKIDGGRILLGTDFEFRGGSRHPEQGSGARPLRRPANPSNARGSHAGSEATTQDKSSIANSQ
jgi:hypothetical protein